MFGTFFEQNVFVYVITAIGICGIMARLVMNVFLRGLVRNVDKMGSTRKKSLMEIRKRYEELTYLDVDIRDTKAFTEKYLYRLKIGKIPFSSFDGFARSMLIFSVGTGLVGAWWQYGSGYSLFESTGLLIFGIAVCGVMLVVNNIFDCNRIFLMLTADLENYLNNSLANRIKRENEKQESIVQVAASVIEPNVIDIDEALGLKPQAPAKAPNSKKTVKQEKRKKMSSDKKMQSETAAASFDKMREKEPEREVSQAQIDACDALFDNLLKGIGTT